MSGDWWQYLVVFVCAISLSLVFTPLAITTALRRGILDKPGGHKSHSSPIPYLGGLAIVAAFSLSMAIPVLVTSSSSVSREFLIVIGIALLLALVGLFDDLRGLSSLVRLLFEASAGLVLWQIGVGAMVFNISWLDAGVTVVWVVGITNAFNLLDNMDGLSAGIATTSCLTFFAIASTNGQFLIAALALALAGCAVGFLRHNFHPARVYMGDSGALFFGFLISFVGLKLQLDIPNEISVLVPILVCSIAILDTTLVTVARLRHGLSPLQGGRDHLSHRLVTIGLPVPIAVGFLYFAASALGVIAFVIVRTDIVGAWTLAGLAGVFLATLGILAYNVPVYANSKQHLISIVKSNPD